MKWIVIVVLALTMVAAVIAFIGTRLPRTHSASRHARFNVPPEQIWVAITDVDNFPSWRPNVKRVTRLPDRGGRKTWTEHTSNGPITMTIDKMDPPRILVTRIADPDLPFGGSWTFEVAPVAGGSTVTITENGEIYNPIFRFVARFVVGYEATMGSYLAALGKHVASSQRV